MIFDPVILLLFSIDTFFLKAFDCTPYAVSVPFRGTSRLATDRKLSAEKILNYFLRKNNYTRNKKNINTEIYTTTDTE